MPSHSIPAGFTLDQLLAYLRERSGEAPGFLTANEWAERFGCYVGRMRRILGMAKRAGKLSMAPVERERLDGQPYMVTGYAFQIEPDEGASGPGAESVV